MKGEGERNLRWEAGPLNQGSAMQAHTCPPPPHPRCTAPLSSAMPTSFRTSSSCDATAASQAAEEGGVFV